MSKVYSKLIKVQAKLKAPKNQYNSFGKYKYRSCEDILEALKPVLEEEKATVFLKDEIISIENRYYIKAIATFVDCEDGEVVEVTALAREEETKKGMDGSQITGTASSYARKYALNGLFLIDDSKDADTDAYKHQQGYKEEAEQKRKPSDKQLNRYNYLILEVKKLYATADEEKIYTYLNNKHDITISKEAMKNDIKVYDIVCNYINELIEKAKSKAQE